MKPKLAFAFVLICFSFQLTIAQPPWRFTPEAQDSSRIQYFTPVEKMYNAGDPIPFYHAGVFHVFYLLDGGIRSTPLTNLQWAHISSTDLVKWKHHPLAVPIDHYFEGTIGTGSAFFANETYHIFHMTRSDSARDGKIWEFISHSTSKDGIHYTKQEPNPLLVAPEGYKERDFRDPHIFYDKKDKLYYMIVTSSKKDFRFKHHEGCLIYYTSKNLEDWEFQGDFYVPGDDEGFAIPECPTLFKWNDWYYLFYKVSGGTYYRMAKTPKGPWAAPEEDNIGNDWALVHKVAEFTGNRRIAVGMVPSREGKTDNGAWKYAGNLVFRELFQRGDGTLYAGLVEEMMPVTKNIRSEESIKVNAEQGFKTTEITDIPLNAHIQFEVDPGKGYEQIGLMLRYSENGYYDLRFSHRKRMITLGNQVVNGVYRLDQPFKVDIIMKDDIIDVRVQGNRCILNRVHEHKGKKLVLYARNGFIEFKNFRVNKLEDW